MCKKILFLSVSNKIKIDSQRMELDGFYIRLDHEFSKNNKKFLVFVLGFNGSQGALKKFVSLQLPALFNEEGQPIIELKKHNVASFDPENDTRQMSLPNFIYFLEEVNKIEIVGDNMIFKDAPSANHKERFDYCLENAVTDCWVNL